MPEEYCSKKFCCVTFFWIFELFATSLLTMIISILNPKDFKIFEYPKNLEDFEDLVRYDFLYNVSFQKELQFYDNYKSTLPSKTNCYEGICQKGSNFVTTRNCSNACKNNLSECYDSKFKCDSFECFNYSYEVIDSLCEYSNQIQKWRNTKMHKYDYSITIRPFLQIKPKNETCPSGFIKCGIINENKDILCLNEPISVKAACPINEIIVNSKPPDNNYNYKNFSMGDNTNKYIFYTNEKIDNYIITDFYITFDTYSKNSSNLFEIDNDTFSNLKQYNNITFENAQRIPSTAYLNVEQFHNKYTYQEMMLYKRNYDMNSDVKENKNLLMGLGIACFSYNLIILVFILPGCSKSCLSGNCCEEDSNCCGLCCLCYICCKCCKCCKFLAPIKHAIPLLCLFLPGVILSFNIFTITISKMKTYNKYSKEEYNDANEINNLFKKSKNYNIYMFICLLINLIITVLYPIIITIVTQKIYDNSLMSKLYETNKTTNIPQNNIQYEPIMYVPPYNIVNKKNNFSQNNEQKSTIDDIQSIASSSSSSPK